MSRRLPFYVFIFILLTVGILTTLQRHSVEGIPWLPNNDREVWEIEARIEFIASGSAILASLALPEVEQPGFTLIRESSSSSDYGVNYRQAPMTTRAVWSRREATGPQVLFYRAQFLVDANNTSVSSPQRRDTRPKLSFAGPERLAATAIRESARARSSNDLNFTLELIKLLEARNDQNVSLLLSQYDQLDTMQTILAEAGIPNRQVGALHLEDGRRRQTVRSILQIWLDDQWLNYDPEVNVLTQPGDVFIWDATGVSLLDITGGRNSRVSFSMISQEVTPQEAAQSVSEARQPWDLSIHSLPLEEQAMFKTIMLIPLGALIVAFMRIIIGLKTSGTFMPILIAMAFVQTELSTGIIGLVVIVSIGLIIRSYLSKLNLLLVARISAVIIAVILMIATLAVLSYRLELTAGLSITFFPMIILAWTIERMSIIWEEDGWSEVAKQSAGSLITAIIVYLAMTDDVIRHLSFNFIGLQLVILAVILMLGNYTGYRLSELLRFKPLEPNVK